MKGVERSSRQKGSELEMKAKHALWITHDYNENMLTNLTDDTSKNILHCNTLDFPAHLPEHFVELHF